MFPPAHQLGIKVCGIRTEDQLGMLSQAGVDAIGLNFWPGSKRYIAPEQAAKWDRSLAAEATLVAVTVDAAEQDLRHWVDSGLVHMVQLHGDETPQQVERLCQLSLPVIKAVRVKDESSVRDLADYACETLLLDAYSPLERGGSGESFCWHLLTLAMERAPHKKFILSGGLTPFNVRQAIECTHPHAVDVASGVESAPGMKDSRLVERFVRECRVDELRQK